VSYDKERYAADLEHRERRKAAGKKWRKANRPKINAYKRERYATVPNVAEAERRRLLLRRYGLTLDGYDAMVKRQDGLCALCRRRPRERLHVDHCHDVRMLRSLLCRSCNLGLGKFGHNPDLMRAGGDYLDIWRIIHARRLPAGAKPLPKRTCKTKKRKGATSPPTSPPTKKPKPRK
jgi:hypothetical protein